MKNRTRACALSATAAAAVFLTTGASAAQDDDVVSKRRSPVAVEYALAAQRQPGLVDFTHSFATQWVLSSAALAGSPTPEASELD
ncbi:hypothetical protein [Diaphorobacter aerolatus]|uniref:Uncharacterized protein n=1 Tax=Diaphorobacter aerolatus TaxID=1288495 RepID=A0A7H0GIF8_9BURK|nr:hypothetical protein [Diaphorobacter aerolatus]QNP48074.1 hypothetical protein H9K75_18680 [Diaphorobacter aerolatus]